jgi:hypothetical protein
MIPIQSSIYAFRGFLLLLPLSCFMQASAALVYSQNFNAATPGTTGTGLGDGSNIIVTNTPGAASVQEWGSLKALQMTKEGIGGTGSNFFLPDLNPGGAVTSFSVSFDLLFQSTDTTYADGISFNFGQLNSTTQTYGSEFGMYNTNFTGDVLSVGWVNYWAGSKRIDVFQNGATVSSNTTYPPFTTVQSSIPGPTVPVTVSWDKGSGLSLTYGGNNVFTNLATPGFTPAAGYKFAFAARTGADTQDTFIDNIQVNTVPEPAATLLGALGFLGLLRRRR